MKCAVRDLDMLLLALGLLTMLSGCPPRQPAEAERPVVAVPAPQPAPVAAPPAAAPPASAEPTPQIEPVSPSPPAPPPSAKAPTPPPKAEPAKPVKPAPPPKPAPAKAAPAPAQAAPAEKSAGPGSTVVVGTIETVSNVPDPSTVPYDTCVTFIKYRVTKVAGGAYEGEELLAVLWGMKKGVLQPAARFAVGQTHRLTIEPFSERKDLARVMQADDTGEYSLTPYWVVSYSGA